MVRNPLFNAGDAGLIPGLETKIPHAGQLSTCPATTELTHSGAQGATAREELTQDPPDTAKNKY